MPPWHYANNTRFRSFGGVYPRDGAVVGGVGGGEIAIFVLRNARLVDKSRRERNVEICFASIPPLFPPLPYFASSNWPVKTNLKNTADVRYDHAADVPRWAGLGSKRLRPCVMPWPKDAKKMTLLLHVPERREKVSPRVRVLTVNVCH